MTDQRRTAATPGPTYPASFSEVVEVTRDIPEASSDAELACDWGNAEACADDNATRAEFASIGVKAYAKRVGTLDEEPALTISDLLGDLMHLCDALGEEFDALVDRGRGHYEPELEGTF